MDVTMETKQEPLPSTVVAGLGSVNDPHSDIEKDLSPAAAEPARKVQGLAVLFTSSRSSSTMRVN